MAQTNWKFLLKIGRREQIRYQRIIEFIESIPPGDRSGVIKEILLAHIEENQRPAKRRTRQKTIVNPTPPTTKRSPTKSLLSPVSSDIDVDDLPSPVPFNETSSEKVKQTTNKKSKVLKTILMGDISDEDKQIIEGLKNQQ